MDATPAPSIITKGRRSAIPAGWRSAHETHIPKSLPLLQRESGKVLLLELPTDKDQGGECMSIVCSSCAITGNRLCVHVSIGDEE